MLQIQTQLQIVIIRHEKETKRRSNTARIASICIPTLQIIEYPFKTSILTVDPVSDILIYPVSQDTTIQSVHNTNAEESEETKRPQPKRLLFLDGTWTQTRKMYRKTDVLHKIPWMILPPSSNPPPKIRKSSFEDGMSTMESVGRAIGFFEDPEKEVLIYKGLSLWIDSVRRNSGITIPIHAGESFSEVRIREKMFRNSQD